MHLAARPQAIHLLCNLIIITHLLSPSHLLGFRILSLPIRCIRESYGR
jgi:hypothetical protein